MMNSVTKNSRVAAWMNRARTWMWTWGAVWVLSAGCGDDAECKSTSDCPTGTVCRNGACVKPGFELDTDERTQQTDTVIDTTGMLRRDSETDFGDRDTESDSVVDGSDSGEVRDCREDWECIDDNHCTVDRCVDGSCEYTAPDELPSGCCDGANQCDDQDPCTQDSCDVEAFRCINTFVSGPLCCRSHDDCDDENECTVGFCGPDGGCQYSVNTSEDDCCDDRFDCQVSGCATPTCTDYRCVYDPLSPLPDGCCQGDDECADDGNSCTTGVCTSRNECEFVPDVTVDGCCRVDGDCEDFNDCTVGTCTFDYRCVFNPVSGYGDNCCGGHSDCDDANPCTADYCVDYICDYHIPGSLPPGCCSDASQCDDGNSCTDNLCVNGRCVYVGDRDLGEQCCLDAGDCPDDTCATPICETTGPVAMRYQCLYAPPVGEVSEECCFVGADCDGGACRQATCGLVSPNTCSYADVANQTPCSDGLFCTGVEHCIDGACVTIAETIPCGGLTNPCRDRICDEASSSCVLYEEFDTDVSCDDGVFCNGVERCVAGDCVHFDIPCRDTSVDECQVATCDEDNQECGVQGMPDNTACMSAGPCDGYSVCLGGVCTAGSACGDGDDCNYYTCEVDSDGEGVRCVSHTVADGTPCETPYYGLCFGSQDRVCLGGTCTIGSDPMCTPSGFCADHMCVSQLGPGNYPDGGCVTDSTGDEFISLSCHPVPDDTDGDVDTDGEPAVITVPFSTALAHDKESSYGACGSGFFGGDLAYRIAVDSGDQLTVTVRDSRTTDGSDVHLFVLTNGCNTASCVTSGENSVTHTAGGDGNVYVVIDMPGGVFAAGELEVSCQ